MAMPVFVNRDEEMQFVRDNCSTLQDQRFTAQLPIIQFIGVGGIGKTRILREVENQCNSKGLHSIWADADLDTEGLSHKVIAQVRKYGVQVASQSDDWLTLSVNATRTLITEKGPAVFLIDSLESAKDTELAWIENLLTTFLNESKLFFLLASQRTMTFEHVRAISRRLNTIQLKPFDENNCKRYLFSRARNFDQEVQDLIYKWTGGYPLAIISMAQAIEQKKLDPRKKKDQQQLLTIIRKQVINQGIFNHSNQSPDRVEWFERMFTLFAVPRRCVNVSFMQGMVEQFESQCRLNNDLAYITLPNQINDKADVFKWNAVKAGFSLDAPIRHIFLKNLEIDQPERYKLINKYLADVNKQLATKIIGIERVRALLEYLYHSARCEANSTLQQIVESTVQQITSGPTDDFWNFHEEYFGDTELQEVLGNYHNTAKSLIYRHLVEIYRQLTTNASRAESLNYWLAIFIYIIDDPTEDDLPHSERWKQSIQDVQKESLEFRKQLVNELQREPKIQQKLQRYPNILLPFTS